MRRVLNLFHFDGMGCLWESWDVKIQRNRFFFVCMIFVSIFNSKREMVLLSS